MLILEKIIGFIAPDDCLVCGDEGSLLCHWCREAAIPPLPSRCYRCKAAEVTSRVCVGCRAGGGPRHLWVRTQYEGTAKQLVHRLKFERARSAAPLIASLMAESIPRFDHSATVVTSVPTATSRIRMRGYDQAELIARGVAVRLGLPYRPLLARLGQSRQVGASRSKRERQLQDAYYFKDGRSLKGMRILLIDDVITTGSSIQQAVRCLRKSGAMQIDAAVFAQKQ